MPKGKTPSLIGSTLGRPNKKICGRKTPCSRCHADIKKNEVCYDVPQLRKPHSTTRRFCVRCYGALVKQTHVDLKKLESL